MCRMWMLLEVLGNQRGKVAYVLRRDAEYAARELGCDFSEHVCAAVEGLRR